MSGETFVKDSFTILTVDRKATALWKSRRKIHNVTCLNYNLISATKNVCKSTECLLYIVKILARIQPRPTDNRKVASDPQMQYHMTAERKLS